MKSKGNWGIPVFSSGPVRELTVRNVTCKSKARGRRDRPNYKINNLSEPICVLSSGLLCFIQSASIMFLSNWLLGLCIILKSSEVKGWSSVWACSLMEEKDGLPIGLFVLGDIPLCSATLYFKFLLVSPIYRALQLRQVIVSLNLKKDPIVSVLVNTKQNLMSG